MKSLIYCCVIAMAIFSCNPEKQRYPSVMPDSGVPDSGNQENQGCPSGMVEIPLLGYESCMDIYEASLWERADCAGKQYGVDGDDYPEGFPDEVANKYTESEFPRQTKPIYACSMKGVIPSAFMTANQAALACQNSGKDICEQKVFNFACKGPEDLSFPYGNEWKKGKCNLYDNPEAPGKRVTTGSFSECVSYYGIYDLAGNVREYITCGEQCQLGQTAGSDWTTTDWTIDSNEEWIQSGAGCGCNYGFSFSYSLPHELIESDEAKGGTRGVRCCKPPVNE